MIGQVFLKRYKVLRRLDEGGMSTVYLGMQTDQPREVAIKVLRPELAVQPKVREHFRREIFIMSKFHHPNSVTFFDADADARHPVLVMEYLRGLDLLHVLERNRRLSPERTGRILGQICSALQAAHDAGIVHRDLKPGNLMIVHPDTPQEKVKLMDFGLAKMSSMLYISPEEMVNLRQPTASGTPEYISPEQVRGNDVDRRADIYSLGVILYEMLTGHRPFHSDNLEELLLAHADRQPPSFAASGATGVASAALERVVLDCLSKYPEDRPQSAEALALRYEEALGRKIYERPQASPASELSRSALLPRKPEERNSGIGTPVNGTPAADRHAIIHRLTATMPESMAMLKLKGFIYDLGGEIIESVPGMIRVRVGEPVKKASGGGLLGWLGGRGSTTAAVDGVINLELLLEKPNLSQPNQLAITLKLTSPAGMFTADGRSRCERIARDLQAYLMGR